MPFGAALASGYAVHFTPERVDAEPRSLNHVEVLGVVYPSSIILICDCGAVKSVDGWLSVEQDSISGVAVVFDDSGPTTGCPYAHVIANLHISLLRALCRLKPLCNTRRYRTNPVACDSLRASTGARTTTTLSQVFLVPTGGGPACCSWSGLPGRNWRRTKILELGRAIGDCLRRNRRVALWSGYPESLCFDPVGRMA